MSAPVIEVRDVEVRAREEPILSGVSLALEAGTLTALVGPNGAGKSTLLRVMTGEWTPRRGTVLLHGRALRAWTPRAMARERSVLPQASSLAFPFTVFEVVRLGLEARGAAALDRVRTEVGAALERVDLAGFGPRLFGELSGGEQQRVHLARVLLQIGAPIGPDGRSRLLLLDEPTSSLDIRHQLAVLDLVRGFARAGGTVFAVLHDLNLAGAYADRVAVLQAGRLVAHGARGEVMAPELLESVFGVRLHTVQTGAGPGLIVPAAFIV